MLVPPVEIAKASFAVDELGKVMCLSGSALQRHLRCQKGQSAGENQSVRSCLGSVCRIQVAWRALSGGTEGLGSDDCTAPGSTPHTLQPPRTAS